MRYRLARGALIILVLCPWLSDTSHAEPDGSAQVLGIRVEHHDGQTFITWKDAAEGVDGAKYRYALYRSLEPITEDNLNSAERVEWGLMNNSAKLFGMDFRQTDRLDPTKPTATIRKGGTPLPLWSGLAVFTAQRTEHAFYAVAATNSESSRLSLIMPGQNATIEPVEEIAAPIQPVKQHDAASLAGDTLRTRGLPLFLELHASEGSGGGAKQVGDYYLYFGNRSMGYRDGVPGIFSVEPDSDFGNKALELYPRDAIVNPNGLSALETFWFGYLCAPQGAVDTSEHAYPFTENRLVWLVNWTVHQYGIDPMRVYSRGYSMGGWGSTTFALRHPELFAAIYAMMPRPRQSWLPSFRGIISRSGPTMPDGTDYFERMDMVKFIATYPGELPFYVWSVGRHDGYASWKDQVDLAKAMRDAHRGFAFAWNNGAHTEGKEPMRNLLKFYAPEKFRRDLSYPALANSSLDNDPGDGDPERGDLVGGINLGYAWTGLIDTKDRWAVQISNELNKGSATVDVTPRRLQHFLMSPGVALHWTTSTGGSGNAVADDHGAITVPRVLLFAGKWTEVSVTH